MDCDRDNCHCYCMIRDLQRDAGTSHKVLFGNGDGNTAGFCERLRNVENTLKQIIEGRRWLRTVAITAVLTVVINVPLSIWIGRAATRAMNMAASALVQVQEMEQK